MMQARNNWYTRQTITQDSSGGFSAVNTQAIQDYLGGILSSRGDYFHATRHSFTKQRLELAYGSIYEFSKSGNYWARRKGVSPYNETYPSETGIDTALFASIGNQAMEKMYDQLRGSVDLSIDLIQHRQVENMVRGRLTREVANLVQTFRKIRHLPSRLASQVWLEYTYGWKPTAMSFVELMKKAVNPQNGVIQLRNRAKQESNPEVNMSAGPGLPVRKFRGYRSHRVEIFSVWNPNNEDLMTQLAGVSSLNPASIAYELIPFSFVVDWFYDIGGYIRLYESTMLYGSSFIRGWRVNTGRSDISLSQHGLSYNKNFDRYTNWNLEGRKNTRYYDRLPLGSPPVPTLPRFKLDLGANRIVSGAALARSLLPRKLDRM
jgi:hypothetical protein